MLKAPHKLGSTVKRRKTEKKRNKEEEEARRTLLLLTSEPWGGTNVAGAGSGIRQQPRRYLLFFWFDGAAAGKWSSRGEIGPFQVLGAALPWACLKHWLCPSRHFSSGRLSAER